MIRRVPLFVRLGDRGVPAYGLALATAFTKVDVDRIPVDRHGRTLVRSAGSELPRGLNVVTVAEIWTPIEERQPEILPRLVAERIVLFLGEPTPGKDRIILQANLLNTVLMRAWLRETPAAWAVLGTVLLAGLAVWLWLSLRPWKATIGTVALVLGYAAVLSLSASLFGVLLPLAMPLVAVLVSSERAALEPAHVGAPDPAPRGRGRGDPRGPRASRIIGRRPRGGPRGRAGRGRPIDRCRGWIACAARGGSSPGRADARSARATGTRVENARRPRPGPAQRRRAGAATPRVRACGRRHPRSSPSGGVPGPREGGSLFSSAYPRHWRARHGQGALRPGGPPPEPPRRRTLRGGQHGGDPG